MGRASSTHGRDKMHTICWQKILKGRDHSEEVDEYGRIRIDWILGKYCGKLWTGCIWLRSGTSGGFL